MPIEVKIPPSISTLACRAHFSQIDLETHLFPIKQGQPDHHNRQLELKPIKKIFANRALFSAKNDLRKTEESSILCKKNHQKKLP